MASGFTTKEWKQRISEFATRRLLSIVSQSSTGMTVDVSRAEGLVSQTGDTFSPENMNGLEQRIANAFANVDKDVEAAKKSASDGKTLIAAAITAKKVAASASDTFQTLANKIGQIVLGSGNATKADVLSGKTFTNNDGVQYTGTMPNRGSYAFSSVNTTGSGNAGYYSGITVDTRPSYNSGYSNGVTDADNRVNTSSASYTSGYNAGKQPISMQVGCGASIGLDTFLVMNIERYSTFSWSNVASICGGGSISVYGDNTLLKTVSLPTSQDGKTTTVNFSANVASYSSLKIKGSITDIYSGAGLAYVNCALS